MNPNMTYIACVIDRSGSMGPNRFAAVSGFNEFLQTQKSLPGEAKLSLVLFNQSVLTVIDNQNIQQVPELTHATYLPNGLTALLDAVGSTIDSLGKDIEGMKEEDRPAKVIMAILTDGLENRSSEYKQDRVAEMIKHQQEKYSWEFIFLGANMDALAQAAVLNIPHKNSMNFAATPVGTQEAMRGISRLTSAFRAGNS